MASNKMAYTMSPKAYGKIVYHCAKYPHRAVNGVILGSYSKKDNCIMIQDTIPLFHNDLNLSVILEVALTQVEIYAKVKGLSIVGCYIGDEDINGEQVLSESIKSIGNKICSNTEHSCIMMVNNESVFSSGNTDPVLKIFTKSEHSDHWKESKQPLSLVGGNETANAILRGIGSGVHRILVDFDSHLDNSADEDWANPKINALIDQQ